MLRHRATDGEHAADVDAVLTMPRSRLNQLLGEVDAAALLGEDDVTVTGDADALRSMLERLHDFGFWSDIVTP